MNCAQDITRYIILSFLQCKDKILFANTCKEHYKMILNNYKIDQFKDLECTEHDTLDECSFIIPNTCRQCVDNYCHKCYKITKDLNHSFIDGIVDHRVDYFDYNTCKDSCIYKCSRCHQVGDGTSHWTKTYEDPVNKFLTFNDYTRLEGPNNIPIEYVEGEWKYQTQHICEKCQMDEANRLLFGKS